MYNNQSLDERILGNVCNDRYGYHNEISESRYFMKWNPEEDMKFYSKSRYGSPRMLSKSVPKNNKSLTRCRINRSLNFDAGIPKTNLKFKSPNSSLDSICCDEEKHLSRSAKIMKALNLSSSPISIDKKKVNKSLNFDFSPSPKKLLHYGRSPCNIVHLNLSTSSPKIGKTLNFEASPAESNISSILGTSIDSMDENQNQTPSQRQRSAKKALKYLTPQRKSNGSPFEFSERSPMLRSELREKIENIIQVSTPNVQSLKKSHKRPPFVKDIFVSTPRNLFNDFQDVEHAGPKTPKNRIRLVPESMSAIKRSHKKERFSRRLEATANASEVSEDDQLARKLGAEKERCVTPPIVKDLQIPQSSIKRSHKKNKSNKSPLNRLEDELSEGSIFDYSEIKDAEVNSPESSTQKFPEVGIEICISSPPRESKTPDNQPPNDELLETPERPSTPQNRIDFLQRVIGSSIKKSHKKLKSENKKKILKPRILDESDPKDSSFVNNNETEDNEPQASCSNSGRSTTPENVNSSRLLLPNFNSVKKSHKKDKRNKILSNFARRQKIFSYDKEKLSNSCCSLKSKSPMSEDFKNYSLQHFNSEEESIKTGETSGVETLSPQLAKSPYSINSSPYKSSLHSSESSPQKRKLSSCSDVDDAVSPLSMNDLESIDLANTNEEFKIFTPIKKRKSAPTRKLTAKEFENVDWDKFDDVPLTRCTTPVFDQSRAEDSIQGNFVTPEKSITCEPKRKSTRNSKVKSKSKVSPENKAVPQNKSTTKSKSTSKNKVTPRKNKLSLELALNVNSVKRSHKKEKKGNRFSFKEESVRLNFEPETPTKEIKSPLLNVSTFLTPEPSLHSNRTNETSFKNISLMASKFLQSYEYDDCRPSTSYESKDIEAEEKKKLLTTTPPNFLKKREYLKSQQSESIKKSHKKKREELKHSLVHQDPELSDDGSIFTEEDRIEAADRAINKKSTGKNFNTRGQVSIVVNMNESLFDDEILEKRRFSRSNLRVRNLSNDGSLFGSDEEIQK